MAGISKRNIPDFLLPSHCYLYKDLGLYKIPAKGFLESDSEVKTIGTVRFSGRRLKVRFDEKEPEIGPSHYTNSLLC